MNTLLSTRPALSVNAGNTATDILSGAVDGTFASIRLPGTEADRRAVTPRQVEIWKLYAQGFGTSQIAERLGLSIKTVDSHRDHLLKRTGTRNAADLTRAAVALGLITVPVLARSAA